MDKQFCKDDAPGVPPPNQRPTTCPRCVAPDQVQKFAVDTLVKYGPVGLRRAAGLANTSSMDVPTSDLVRVQQEVRSLSPAPLDKPVGGTLADQARKAVEQALSATYGSPPHLVLTINGDLYPFDDEGQLREVGNLAKSKGVMIDVNVMENGVSPPLGNSGGQEPLWQEMAQLTGGRYFKNMSTGDLQGYMQELAESVQPLLLQ